MALTVELSNWTLTSIPSDNVSTRVSVEIAFLTIDTNWSFSNPLSLLSLSIFVRVSFLNKSNSVSPALPFSSFSGSLISGCSSTLLLSFDLFSDVLGSVVSTGLGVSFLSSTLGSSVFIWASTTAWISIILSSILVAFFS